MYRSIHSVCLQYVTYVYGRGSCCIYIYRRVDSIVVIGFKTCLFISLFLSYSPYSHLLLISLYFTPFLSLSYIQDIKAPSFDPSPYSSLGVRLEVVPVKDSRQLEITWPTPSVEGHFDSKPMNYLSHLIGHEGPGSILSLLKAKVRDTLKKKHYLFLN